MDSIKCFELGVSAVPGLTNLKSSIQPKLARAIEGHRKIQDEYCFHLKLNNEIGVSKRNFKSSELGKRSPLKELSTIKDK